MKKYLFLLWLTAGWMQAFAQSGEPAATIRGIVLSEDLNEPVPLANIFNRSTGTRYISNRQGIFRIVASPSDTVEFSGIGYGTKIMSGSRLLTGRDDTITITLQTTVYRLRDVNIVYSNARRDSIARAAAEFLKDDPLMNNHDRIINRERGSMMSPLTAMYESFSKAGEDMVRFEEFLAYAEKQKAVDRRYNKKVIRRVTSLPDHQLDDFIMYCKLDRDFILTSPEYDFILAIKQCGDNFRMRK